MNARWMNAIVKISRQLLAGLVLSATCMTVRADLTAVSLKQVTGTPGEGSTDAVIGVAFPGGNSLGFELEMDYRCPSGTEGQQLFVSIADSMKTEAAPAGALPRTVRMDVPLKQLEWLMEPGKSCRSLNPGRAPDWVDDRGIRYFRMPAAAMAYATLLCTRATAPAEGATTTQALDAWLSCPAD